jgi:antitoxin CptB
MTDETITDKNLENKRKQLIFRSWHRGTREMDLIMGSFADQNVHDFNEQELETYAQILQIPDPDLYDWVSGRKKPPANQLNPVLEKFINHDFTAKD